MPTARIEAIERARGADDGILTRSLTGPNLPLARRAALALGRTKRQEAAVPLARELGARDDGLRAMSAFALGLVGRPVDLTAMVALLRGDRSSAVRYAAADAIGRIVYVHPELATRILAEALERAMVSDPDATVRGHAAANLDVFGKMPSSATVARSLESAIVREPSQDVRWHEMWAEYRGFSLVADPHFLAAQLQSRDELVRVEALRAVGRRKDPGAEHFVRPLVADPSWRVQLQARETLLALSGKPPTEHLTSFPPALNLPSIPLTPDSAPAIPLPPIEPPSPGHASAPATAASPAMTLSAPDASAVFQGPPLAPTSAESMNAPMRGMHPRVRLHTTRGDLVVRFYPEWAPVAVANFLGLTTKGFFDGNRWFRVVPDFVHQTGEIAGDPDREPGYTIGAEENPIEQRSAIVAMGLDYDKGHAVRDSAGTQFYITDSPQLHLDRDFSVFGELESGFDVLANLVESDKILKATRIGDD